NITKDLTASLDLNMDVRDDMKPYWVNDRGRDNMADYFNMYVLYTPGMRPSYINGLPVGNDMSVNFMQMLNDEYGYHNRKYYNYEANIALRYNVPVVPGLSLKLMYNNYDRHNFTKIFTVPYTRYIFKTTGEHGHILTDEVDRTDIVSTNGNFLSEEYKKTRNYQMNAFINYDRTFGKHDISAVLLFEQSEGNIDQFSAQVRNYVTSIVDQLSFGSKDPNDFSIGGSGSETARQSYAGRIHYGYADKYLMEVSMRYDGSIVFAKTGRWGFFPSASAAWRISEERFFKDNVKFISNLKLRGSVGSLGNDRDANGDPFYWQWLQLYGYSTGAQYGNSAMGIMPGVTPNVEITWEKSVTWNGGLDAGFMDNRLTLGVDVFKKHTYDILGSRINTLPSTFGGSMPAENYGVVDSKGYEVEAAYTNRIGKDFLWRVAGNISYSTNKLVKRDEAENIPAYLSGIGYHTDRSRGYIFTDLIRTQADLDALPEGYTINGAKPQLGMMNYKDIRGVTSDEPDGKITSEDQDWIMNHTTPPISYGFSLGGSWKGWELNLFFQGVSGHTSAISYRDQNSRVSKKNLAVWTDHWTPENTDAVYPRAERPNSASYPVSTFWTRDASFLRLKNLDLSYTFQKPVLSALGVSQLRIFLTGSNLFLLEDHVKIYDPETSDTMSYPIMRSYSMGVSLSF
ncbi:MAG: SusC/RagA family TonB-linked outer membrane protein, partial [Tannerellaceae bacterium]|nr:SusC/RagA family TonB-linked outer membrane protein [Tannerellaceae bacterium]